MLRLRQVGNDNAYTVVCVKLDFVINSSNINRYNSQDINIQIEFEFSFLVQTVSMFFESTAIINYRITVKLEV